MTEFEIEEKKRLKKQADIERSPSGLSELDELTQKSSTKGAAKEDEKEEVQVEVGLFHLLDCDIKASDDQIRSKFMEKSIFLTDLHEKVLQERAGLLLTGETRFGGTGSLSTTTYKTGNASAYT